MIENPISSGSSFDQFHEMLTRGETSCRLLVEDCLRSCDRWSFVNAWSHLDREGTLAQADRLDAEWRAGRSLGPLHGLPIGVKDIVDVAGMPTTAGVKHWSTGPAQADAEMVARLRQAGAIIMGKTVTTPYAWIDPPPTLNPYNPLHTPGGSSSGSAAAVACGMVYAAIGTQTGGSIIRPAAFCGVLGWKPAFASKPSTQGIVPFAASLDTPGFLTRDVSCLKTLEHLFTPQSRARDPRANIIRPRWLSVKNADWLAQTLRAPRLGRLVGFFDDRATDEMHAALDAALGRWMRDGCEVVEVEFPSSLLDLHRAHRIVMSVEVERVHRDRFARMPEDYPPRITALIREASQYSATDYQNALRVGVEIARFVPKDLDLDAWVTPAAPGPAPGLDTTGDPVFNSPWTFGGQPAISVPIGLSQEGLPLGAQLVGTPGDEADLLDIAAWCVDDPELRPLSPKLVV